MRLLVAAIIFITFSPNPSFATVLGSWSGSGRAWDTDGFKTECKKLEATLKQANGAIELSGLKWNCVDAGFTWSSLLFPLKDGKLFEGEKEAGTFVPSKLSVLTGEIDMPVFFEFSLKSDDVLLYHEEWKGKESTFYVEGELKRLP